MLKLVTYNLCLCDNPNYGTWSRLWRVLATDVVPA